MDITTAFCMSLCDCVNHQSDLWSGYWNKAVGLWLGNCKNWIRRFWACESKKEKRKNQQASNPRSTVVLCVLSVQCQWGGGYRGIIQWYCGIRLWWIMPGLEDVPKPRFEKLWKRRRREIGIVLKKNISICTVCCYTVNVSSWF